MYKEKISRYIDAHRKEMLEDIGALTVSENRMGKGAPRHCVQLCILRNATVFPSTTTTTMLEPLT